MRGLITKKDVLFHPCVVISSFGFKIFIRSLAAPRGLTFLEVISEGIPHPASPAQVEMTQQIDRLAAYELQCSSIYGYLGEIFSASPQIRNFFRTLSYQEQGHSEILRLAKVEMARRNLWPRAKLLDPATMHKLEQMLIHLDLELKKEEKPTLKKALQVIETIEASEKEMLFDFLHHFHEVVQIPFLRKIHRIIPSFADHQSYINTMLPLLKEMETHEERARKRNHPE